MLENERCQRDLVDLRSGWTAYAEVLLLNQRKRKPQAKPLDEVRAVYLKLDSGGRREINGEHRET